MGFYILTMGETLDPLTCGAAYRLQTGVAPKKEPTWNTTGI